MKSRTENGIHYPKTAGTRPPFGDDAHNQLPTLDQVAVVINSEDNRDLKINQDSHYKDKFRREGFPQHTSPQKEGDHPVKIYAPEVTPYGAKRFPNSATSKLI